MKSPQKQSSSLKSARDMKQQAALESHVRLQSAQEEYLLWLKEQEKGREVDAYFYKKIR